MCARAKLFFSFCLFVCFFGGGGKILKDTVLFHDLNDVKYRKLILSNEVNIWGQTCINDLLSLPKDDDFFFLFASKQLFFSFQLINMRFSCFFWPWRCLLYLQVFVDISE